MAFTPKAPGSDATPTEKALAWIAILAVVAGGGTLLAVGLMVQRAYVLQAFGVTP